MNMKWAIKQLIAYFNKGMVKMLEIILGVIIGMIAGIVICRDENNGK